MPPGTTIECGLGDAEVRGRCHLGQTYELQHLTLLHADILQKLEAVLKAVVSARTKKAAAGSPRPTSGEARRSSNVVSPGAPSRRPIAPRSSTTTTTNVPTSTPSTPGPSSVVTSHDAGAYSQQLAQKDMNTRKVSSQKRRPQTSPQSWRSRGRGGPEQGEAREDDDGQQRPSLVVPPEKSVFQLKLELVTQLKRVQLWHEVSIKERYAFEAILQTRRVKTADFTGGHMFGPPPSTASCPHRVAGAEEEAAVSVGMKAPATAAAASVVEALSRSDQRGASPSSTVVPAEEEVEEKAAQRPSHAKSMSYFGAAVEVVLDDRLASTPASQLRFYYKGGAARDAEELEASNTRHTNENDPTSALSPPTAPPIVRPGDEEGDTGVAEGSAWDAATVFYDEDQVVDTVQDYILAVKDEAEGRLCSNYEGGDKEHAGVILCAPFGVEAKGGASASAGIPGGKSAAATKSGPHERSARSLSPQRGRPHPLESQWAGGATVPLPAVGTQGDYALWPQAGCTWGGIKSQFIDLLPSTHEGSKEGQLMHVFAEALSYIDDHSSEIMLVEVKKFDQSLKSAMDQMAAAACLAPRWTQGWVGSVMVMAPDVAVYGKVHRQGKEEGGIAEGQVTRIEWHLATGDKFVQREGEGGPSPPEAVLPRGGSKGGAPMDDAEDDAVSVSSTRTLDMMATAVVNTGGGGGGVKRRRLRSGSSEDEREQERRYAAAAAVAGVRQKKRSTSTTRKPAAASARAVTKQQLPTDAVAKPRRSPSTATGTATPSSPIGRKQPNSTSTIVATRKPAFGPGGPSPASSRGPSTAPQGGVGKQSSPQGRSTSVASRAASTSASQRRVASDSPAASKRSTSERPWN